MNEGLPLTVRGSVDPSVVERWRSAATRHRTLGEVVAWGLALEPRRLVRDVIKQDEYTEDVLIEIEPEVFLVYDAS